MQTCVYFGSRANADLVGFPHRQRGKNIFELGDLLLIMAAGFADVISASVSQRKSRFPCRSCGPSAGSDHIGSG